MIDERIHQVVKGYELHEQLGEGGYGIVFRAYQPLVGRDVAIKIILPQYANHPDFIRRFESEAQLVARLEHPYIVPLYDYWREPDGAYLVMRYLRGGSLHDLLHGGPLSLDTLDRMLGQVGGALAAAHRRGVVHRDLKPANIPLDEDGNAYLADFGIAKDIGSKPSPFQTDQQAVIGSPAYIAPEQVKAEPLSPRTDIYSLGVMLYEILTGQLPFQAPTPIALMFKHHTEHVPPVREIRPDLPDAVNIVIQRATAKRPDDRYPDVLAMVRELRQALGLGQRHTGRLAELSAGRPTVRLDEHPDMSASAGARTRSAYATSVIELPAQLVPAEELIENPYKGLRAFQEADAADFFGREALTQLLLARMQEPAEYARFLAVVGPSGSGKSSVVRAGLVPAIKCGALPASESWFVLELFPGAHPAEELAEALLRIAVDPPNNLIEPLKLDEAGLLRVVDQVVPGGDETEVVLVIDQFEEVFTMVEDEAERQHFLDTIACAVTDPYSRVRVVATLRADFYDRPLQYPRFSELVRQRTEVVVPLSQRELRAAIVSPAERSGLRVDSDLVKAIVDDVGEQPGALPLLQYALTEVFERRSGRTLTLTPYHDSGGVLGALARRAEEIYAGLAREQQEIARQLFLRLVTLGEGVEDTRRRVRRAEVVPAGGDARAVDAVIDMYGQYRLLTLDRDPVTRAPTVEVAHEALIRTWGRLRQWLDASREDLRAQRRLSAAVAEWAASGQESSFLASGQRLDQFEAWAAEAGLALNAEERAYLDASLAERAARRASEQARKAREAALERRSRVFLRALVAVFAVAAIVALGLSFFAFQQRTVAIESERRAEQNASTAATAQAQAQQQAGDNQNLALANGAQVALGQDNADLALTLAMAANTMARPVPQARYTLSDAAYRPGTRRLFAGHTAQLWDVAVSPDGARALTASRDKTLILWDLATGAKLRTLTGHTKVVRQVAFSPDGAAAVSSSQDGTLIVWDLASGAARLTLTGHADEVHAVAFSPDGKTVLSGSDDKTLMLWDAATGQLIRTLNGHTQPVNSVAYDPADSRLAISGSDDQDVILWNLATGERVRTFKGAPIEVQTVAFSPDGTRVLAGSVDSSIYMWDAATGELVRTFKGHKQQVNTVAFSPDGRTIASGANDSLLGLWDSASGEPIQFLNVGAQVRGVAFTPDGARVLTASADGVMRLWDIANGAQLVQLREPAAVSRVALSADGRSVLAGLADHTMRLQALDTGTEIRQFDGHEDVVKDIAFSPDGRTALSAANDGFMILWDVASGQAIRRYQAHPNAEIYAVAFGPDGKTALSGGSGDNAMILWDVLKGTEIMSYTAHTDSINTVVYSPDGKAGLSVSSDRTMVLWDLASGKALKTFKDGHTAKIRDAVFSRDGKTLLSASEDKTLILWDVATARPIRHFVQHSAAVWAVALSPDGTMAASGSDDDSVIVWDVATGWPLRRFVGHQGAVGAVAFSPDGKAVLSASNDGTIRQWRIDTPDELIAWTRANRYMPELTCEQELLYRLQPSHCEADELSPTPARP
jgi:WD40 repeat protein